MFSKTCEYGIRAMIFLAHHAEIGDKVGIKKIAEGINAPEHFIAKIMQALCRENLVCSIKGPNGGFFFDKAPTETSIADIVRAIDGDKIFSSCVLGLHQCSESRPCPIHFKFKDIRQQIADLLQTATLASFQHHDELNLSYLLPDCTKELS